MSLQFFMSFDVLCARTPQTWAFLGMVLCFVEFCMCAKFISQVNSPVTGLVMISHHSYTNTDAASRSSRSRYMYMQYAASLPDQQVPHSVSNAEMLKAGTVTFFTRDIFGHKSQLQTPTKTISSYFINILQHAHISESSYKLNKLNTKYIANLP